MALWALAWLMKEGPVWGKIELLGFGWSMMKKVVGFGPNLCLVIIPIGAQLSYYVLHTSHKC
jgi:hypothetical protein